MDKSIITVIGKDKVGIIAAVCSFLAENNVNILDITQTIRDGFFNMMMIVDISGSPKVYDELVDGIAELSEKLGMQIRIQKEDIFDAMHRI